MTDDPVFIESRCVDGRVWYSANDLITVLRALADAAADVRTIVVLRSIADSLDLATITYITDQPEARQ